MKTLGQIIDFIFVRGLHPKNSNVLGHLKSSDHKAMMAELALD
jgi:endonuclease/exonuclease/phosphatase (EEP) superfamily protein YafD